MMENLDSESYEIFVEESELDAADDVEDQIQFLEGIIKEHQCTDCDMIFYDRNELKSHMYEKHFTFKCPTCGKAFYRDAQLNKHLRTNHLERMSLPCYLCDKRFARKWNLQQHLYTHSEVPVFKCSFLDCEKEFYHINTLQHHENMHMNYDRKQCKICNKYVSSLTSHLLTHTDTKMYQCDQCAKKYTRANQLEEHKLSHVGVRISCDKCSATFSQNSSMWKHKKIMHGSEKRFPCVVCYKTFNRKDNMMQHVRKVHNYTINTEMMIKRVTPEILKALKIVPIVKKKENPQEFC